MSKIHGMLDVGRRSMMNSQTALQTVGHNIANKSTEGYSRQRVEIKANLPVSYGNLRIGTGARSAAITRTNNPYLERQIGKEQGHLGYAQGKSEGMARVESVYNEQANKGLNQFVTDFFNAFRELANNPESIATRTLVRETADFVTRDFHRIDNQFREIRRDLDQQIATNVDQINELSREIGQLNEKVQQVELAGTPANDERDRRDLLIKQLGEKVNIRWAEGDDGMVTITAGNSALLVSGYDAKKFSVAPTPASGSKGEGNFDIFYTSKENLKPVVVTGQLTGGTIGGLLEVRDQTIDETLANIDSMAYTLASEINDLHVQGFDAFNQQGDLFFRAPNQLRGAASGLELSKAVKGDPLRIAAASQINAPADNRIANAISQLQHVKVMDEGNSTIDDFYNGVVGRVGIIAQRANTALESQGEIVKQLTNIRESISGVSLDEETTKLIEFQKSFDASARLIRTADEMFDTVLSLKRM